MAIALDSFDASPAPADGGVRREERDEKIRIVEYSCFPRVAPQQCVHIGFTRDISTSGVCLGVDRAEPLGSLLRLSLRDIEGHRSDDCVGRVVWSSHGRDGRHWLGLELLTKPPASSVSVTEHREGAQITPRRAVTRLLLR